ncbi:predicted protein [Naegleria gruberi]|uniref:Predicted protein n=1 Tax=Naegleria gruberi TaxID=5762 RepID=D2VS65_NAEGR|nr:uncharacterized protein NAEGRDRAFT_81038 [Naegleria gruberi]EFC40372.1 predicted protein [Naegleria gruberi]|eukprot:XP_002673116.1 predicted protein [Naegleria gruberi strain NEG-M]
MSHSAAANNHYFSSLHHLTRQQQQQFQSISNTYFGEVNSYSNLSSSPPLSSMSCNSNSNSNTDIQETINNNNNMIKKSSLDNVVRYNSSNNSVEDDHTYSDSSSQHLYENFSFNNYSSQQQLAEPSCSDQYDMYEQNEDDFEFLQQHHRSHHDHQHYQYVQHPFMSSSHTVAANMTTGQPIYAAKRDGFMEHASIEQNHYPSLYSRPMMRIHIFPNGSLQHGKIVSFDPTGTSFEDLIMMVCSKFRYTPFNDIGRSDNSDILPKLISLRGTEVDGIDQIVNNDTFCFVPPNEPFRPPISIERVILSNIDSSQQRAYQVYTPPATAIPSRTILNQKVQKNAEEILVGPPQQPVASSLASLERSNIELANESVQPVGNNTETILTPTKKSNNNKFSNTSSPIIRTPRSQIVSVHRPHSYQVTTMVDSLPFAGNPIHFASPSHYTSTPPRTKKQVIRLIPELYYQIFSFLTHKELALGIGLVCKEFEREFAKNEMLWKEICMNVYSYYVKRKYQNVTNSKSLDKCPRFFSQTPLNEIKKRFMTVCEKPPCYYKSWKTYYRFFINWALKLCWDTCERGNNIKFKNNNATVYREDNITYHWQTVRTNLPIRIPTEIEKRKNGYMTLPLISPLDLENGDVDIITDDVAILEVEIKIEKFDKTNANGWWIVIGLETETFPYKESTPTNLVGYDRHGGFGYAGGNGDNLHFYSNTHLKHKQAFTCDPVVQWNNVPFNEGDIVKARVKYYLKAFEDAVDPKNNIGATLSWYLNGKCIGECFRNITGVLYPAVSLLTNQSVTLRCVDPMFELISKDVVFE